MLYVGLFIIAGVISAMAMSKSNRWRGSQMRIWIYALIGIIVFFTVLTSYMRWTSNTVLDSSGIYDSGRVNDISSLRPGETFYGIMFDAGSTGSRIHVFKFEQGASGKPFKYVKELFAQVKPGLSAYANRPKEGAESLIKMLNRAKDMVPQHLWSSTPIALKATAGLRLLPQAQSVALLVEVRKLFKRYPFHLKSDGVQIMGGTDEGLYSWFTANFLMGTLDDKYNMVGVLDLGGGSTQITFVPAEKNSQARLETNTSSDIYNATLISSPKSYLRDINIFKEKYTLYTHSYLGLGLISARFQILGGVEFPKSANDKQPSSFSSPCLPAGYSGKWMHRGKAFVIRGEDVKNPYDRCFAKAREVVQRYKVHKPQELNTRNIMLISYYFDRAKDLLILDGDGGNLKVSLFLEASEENCITPSKTRPFLCMDSCYIGALLTEGFGFNKEKEVMVNKKIEDTEISWAMGAMFQEFQNRKKEAVDKSL